MMTWALPPVKKNGKRILQINSLLIIHIIIYGDDPENVDPENVDTDQKMTVERIIQILMHGRSDPNLEAYVVSPPSTWHRAATYNY